MILGIHHAQITVPKGAEDRARDFYCRLLGLKEVEKPENLRGRGGLWLQLANAQVHIGAEDGVDRNQTKAHVAYEVDNIADMRRILAGAGIEALDGIPIPGYDRFEFRDPFGNRVELIQRQPLVVRELEPSDEDAFVRAVKAWPNDGFQFIGTWYTSDMPFQTALQVLHREKVGQDLKSDRVPGTMMFGFWGGEIVGRVSIRHRLNSWLERIGGHIGYGVLPQYRGRGYATEMLRAALTYSRGLGIDRALVTCDEDNMASQRIIEKCGGVLENKVIEDGVAKLRFWISI